MKFLDSCSTSKNIGLDRLDFHGEKKLIVEHIIINFDRSLMIAGHQNVLGKSLPNTSYVIIIIWYSCTYKLIKLINT